MKTNLLVFPVPAAAESFICNASAASGVIFSVCANADSNLDSADSSRGQFDVGRKVPPPDSNGISAVGRGGGGRRSTGGGRSERKLSKSTPCRYVVE